MMQHHKTANRAGRATAGLAALLLLAGCASPPEAPRVINTPTGRSLTVGFVYQEEVYSAGAPFSLADYYWDAFFPAAATAFKEARRFDSYEAAIQSDIDVIVLAEATVHGVREGFKLTMELSARNVDERELLRHGFRERTGTEETAGLVFQGFGRQAADILRGSRKLSGASRTVYDLNAGAIQHPGDTK